MAQSILLKDLPKDIQKIIDEKQASEKKACDCIRSKQYAIIAIIREWNGGRNAKGPEPDKIQHECEH